MGAMMKKAYSILNIKNFDSNKRIIEGWATTPTLDRVGDSIDPFGVTAAKSIPLLLHHDSRLPVGQVELLKATKNGIPFRATIPVVSEPGVVKDRIDEAIHSLQYKLIGAVSIGFRVLNDAIERLDEGFRFLETEVMELSLVVIPAQPEAVITGIKSFDEQLNKALSQKVSSDLRTASGKTEDQQQKTAPAGSGIPSGVTEKKKHVTVKLSPESQKVKAPFGRVKIHTERKNK